MDQRLAWWFKALDKARMLLLHVVSCLFRASGKSLIFRCDREAARASLSPAMRFGLGSWLARKTASGRRLLERKGLLLPPRSDPGLPDEVALHIANSYPHNHNYLVRGGQLMPREKLKERSEQLWSAYPDQLDSLLDLSCSKGYFVFEAAARPGCGRALGIDIDDGDLTACRAVKEVLGSSARFAKLQLHELVDSIDSFGGPFQTVLLINCYQYLYFGSSRSPACYRSHDAIFALLRRVCCGRVVFSNRTELSQLQRYCRAEAARLAREGDYNGDAILAAAARHFNTEEYGRLGGLPVWTLDVT